MKACHLITSTLLVSCLVGLVACSKHDGAPSTTPTPLSSTTVQMSAVIAGPASVDVNQILNFSFTGESAVSLAVTGDSGSDSYEIILTVAHGTLGVTSTAGVTITRNNFAILTLDGSLAALTSALATLSYSPTPTYTGSDTLNITVQVPWTTKLFDTSVSINDTSGLSAIPVDVWGDTPPNAFVDGLTIYEYITLNGQAQASDIASFYPGATTAQIQSALAQLNILFTSGMLNISGDATPTQADAQAIFEDIVLGGHAQVSDIASFYPGATTEQLESTLAALAILYPTN